MQDPRHVETAWGSVVVVRHDGSVAVLHEKALSAKLELLYSKSLFLVALNLAQSEEVSLLRPSRSDESHTVEVISCRLSHCAQHWRSADPWECVQCRVTRPASVQS